MESTSLLPIQRTENVVLKLSEVPTEILPITADTEEYEPFKRRDVSVKAIKKLVALTRSTYEYRKIFWYLKNALDVNRCVFYEGYSMDNGFTIELHHAPLTLFDIVEAIVKREHDKNGGWYETFVVTREAALLHYQLKVGLVPLNPTAHSLTHEGLLPIHSEIILGYWMEFYNEYEPYLSGEAKEKINDLLAFSKAHDYREVPEIMRRKHYLIDENEPALNRQTFSKFLDNKTRLALAAE